MTFDATADRKTEPNSSEKPNNCTDCECTDDCSECKEAEHGCKTENSSEKPNNCETCKHNKLEWFSEICDGCSKANSHYEPKDEPQKCYLRESCDHYGDKQVCGRCREYNLYSHTKTEPQTDCAWGKSDD